MSLSAWVLGWLAPMIGRSPKAMDAAPAPKAAGRVSRMAINDAILAARAHRRPELVPISPHPVTDDPFRPYQPIQAAKDAGAVALAFDDAFFPELGLGTMNFREGIGFFGYPILAEMSQRAEYRKMVEILAMDMTREWVRFTYSGDEDKTDRISQIENEFRRLRIQEAFRKVTELDGFFGRGHLFIDLDNQDDDELSTLLILNKNKIKKGKLRRITVVDPTWTYPGGYDSTNPLSPHFYRPSNWYVMAKNVHHTRLLTFTLRPVPDMLKPAYAFGGLSLIQMAKPYVDNWLRNRQSVSDLLHSFTVFWLKTDLGNMLLGGDAETMNSRADLFNALRDNRGLMLLQKGNATGDTGEELGNTVAPLAGLNELLSGSQEQLSFVAGEPLVKLIGTTPSGLNASSDGEVRVYYDGVHAAQDRLYRDPLEHLLKIVQLSLFGEIDDDIGFEFKPLWQLDETEEAAARKSDADVDVAYVNAGVLSPEEVRGKLAGDKTSPWANLDVEDVPEPPEQPSAEFGAEGEGGGEEAEGQPGGSPDRQAKDAAIVSTYDLGGLTVCVETPKGTVRRGRGPQGPWKATVAADYGYIDDTWSTEGRGEQMDCFVGPNRSSDRAFVIDQRDHATGVFDEHKIMLGYDDEVEAVEDYCASYDAAGRDRIMAVSGCSLGTLKRWLKTGDLYRPYAKAAKDSPLVARPYGADAEFKEADHPRADNGQFGSGGGGSFKSSSTSSAVTKTSLSGGRKDKGEAAKKDKGGAAKAASTATSAAKTASATTASSEPYFSAAATADLPHPRTVRSPAASWEQAETMGAEGRVEFKGMLDKVASRMGLSTDLATPDDLTPAQEEDGKSYLFLAPNKSYKRAAEKVAEDYGGDWTMLKDLVRATIAVQSVDQVREAVKELEAAGIKLASKPKDNITTVKPEGYRDLNLLVTLPNGMPAELQINVKTMVVAKVEAHRYYEQAQEIERKYGDSPPDATWTPDDKAKWDGLMVKQREVYDPAWKKAGGSI